MKTQQPKILMDWCAVSLAIGIVGLLSGCMHTTSTPADYKQSVLVMQEQQTLNPDAKNVPGAESMQPIDGNYEAAVMDVYRGAVSEPSVIRSDIEFSIESGGGGS